MNRQELSILDAALQYREMGFSVIPVKKSDKKPYLETWEKYQRERASAEQIRAWWKEWPTANVAIITGAISNSTVVADADSVAGLDALLELIPKGLTYPMAKTPREGRYHLYFCSKNGLRNAQKFIKDCDFRANGGYVVAPPSKGPNGKNYYWVAGHELLNDVVPPDLPEAIEKALKRGELSGINKPEAWQNELVKGVKNGARHSVMNSLIGRYITKGLTDEEILPLVQAIDAKNDPPLAEEESLLKFIQSVRRTHERNHLPQEDPLRFPDIISGVAGEFAKLYSTNLEVSEPFLYMAFFACIGSILAKSLKLNTELDIQARLYLLLLGESADERKSTALKKTIQFFKEILKFEFQVCWGVNSDAGLQKMFQKNSNLLLAVDELKQLLGKCKIEGSTLLPMITTLFESDTFEAHTKHNDIFIDNASLSLLAASTIETYETVWHSSFTAIGFNNRLWLVPGGAERRFSFPTKIPEREKSLVKQKAIKIFQLVGKELELDISPEGKELFQDWYMNLEQSVHTKRLDGYALRFMALLAVNDLKKEIDLEIVKKAIALCNWQLKVRHLYDPIDADNTIAEMEERIRRYLKQGKLTQRQLKQKLQRIIKRTGIYYFTKALTNLQMAKDIYFKRDGKAIFIHILE